MNEQPIQYNAEHDYLSGKVTVKYESPYAVICLPDGTELLKIHPVAGAVLAQELLQAYTEYRDATA